MEPPERFVRRVESKAPAPALPRARSVATGADPEVPDADLRDIELAACPVVRVVLGLFLPPIP